MIRIGRKYHLLLVMTMTLLTVSCSQEEDQIRDLQAQIDKTEKFMIYDGEWTVDKQVVETAHLSIRNDLAVAFLAYPVTYLKNLFFQNEDSLIVTQWFHYPLNISEQAFSEIAKYESFIPADRLGESEYIIGGFEVTKNRITKHVTLITNELGNGLYRLDTGLWTISFSISSYYITNGATGESSLYPLPEPITLYYNAKKRIE